MKPKPGVKFTVVHVSN